ncbi:MAG: class I SAM-dependent methyltransferase [Actinomycetia bacterium]|nr:class I SAM-dependent methyltransferase [Actinomycetes bacterium]
MVEKSQWMVKVEQDPGHSAWYIERFRTMAAEGNDLAGEARFVDALVGRGARILDAGCGPGRVGAFLHGVGHEVVGVDVDPALIEAAEQDHPGPTWLVADLAELDLPSRGIADGFDAILCAGNVMTFLAPSTRVEVLTRMGRHLGDDGRIAVGFGGGRGYDFDEFRADCEAAGLALEVELESWDLRPFAPNSGFLVALLGRA